MDTILIIDDNISLLESLAAVVGTQVKNGTILTATNGREGIETINSVPVSLILTDLDMPVMDGYEVIKHRNKSCPQVPLFVISGSLFPEVRAKLSELRVSGCLEKPFSFEEVMELIDCELNVAMCGEVRDKRPRLRPAAANSWIYA